MFFFLGRSIEQAYRTGIDSDEMQAIQSKILSWKSIKQVFHFVINKVSSRSLRNSSGFSKKIGKGNGSMRDADISSINAKNQYSKHLMRRSHTVPRSVALSTTVTNHFLIGHTIIIFSSLLNVHDQYLL